MKRILQALFVALTMTSAASAVQVLVPDNGFGTAVMPIQANYNSNALTPMNIVDGLPVGSQINISAVLNAPSLVAEQAGGSLGGTKSGGGGTPVFTWTMQGTGVYAGYNRVLSFPAVVGPGGVLSFADPVFVINGGQFEVHAEPRTLNAAVQSFDTTMFRLFNQIASVGDPDFDLIRIVAGTDFGLPSPGHTTLTQVGPNWNVDSFFDLTYRIDFVGRPGGPFSGRSGSTTGTTRLELGERIIPEPASCGLLMALAAIALPRRKASR